MKRQIQDGDEGGPSGPIPTQENLFLGVLISVCISSLVSGFVGFCCGVVVGASAAGVQGIPVGGSLAATLGMAFFAVSAPLVRRILEGLIMSLTVIATYLYLETDGLVYGAIVGGIVIYFLEPAIKVKRSLLGDPEHILRALVWISIGVLGGLPSMMWSQFLASAEL